MIKKIKGIKRADSSENIIFKALPGLFVLKSYTNIKGSLLRFVA